MKRSNCAEATAASAAASSVAHFLCVNGEKYAMKHLAEDWFDYVAISIASIILFSIERKDRFLPSNNRL